MKSINKGESKESEMKTCWLSSAVVLALLDGCSSIALWSLLPQKTDGSLKLEMFGNDLLGVTNALEPPIDDEGCHYIRQKGEIRIKSLLSDLRR